ncbi:MAG: amidohydrolase [Eubacteriales bacterium]|nr:amidohydrolase [Eubacteriales bacterium]MDD3350049.1 amidohydrolase [Eubacteriales bacterium]
MEASLLLKGNAIFDSVSDEPFAGFVAIKENKIIAVGSPEKAAAYIGKNTKVIDCEDRLLMPGFHDSHTHLILAGMYKACANLGIAHSEEEAAELLWKFEQANPSEGWVYGFNWYHVFWDEKILPTKATLDHYFPDRPVFLLNAEAHGAWVNSKALELAGVTKETPDPLGGEVARLENGEPSGFLYEGAVAYVGACALKFSAEQERLYLKKFMETAAPLGITSLIDVQPYFGANLGSADTYRLMEENGELTVRIHVASDLFGDLELAAKKAALLTGDKVRANLVKQFVDGVFTTHTALMLEDYTDAPGNRGIQLCEFDKIEQAIKNAHKNELSVKIHAIGDHAIRFTLDCYEAAIAAYGKNRARHAIEHIELISDIDIPRFRELGIVPSVQPEHLGLMPTWEGEEYRYVLGEERAANTWRFKTLLDTSGVIALGSDCPVVDNNPFYAIHRGLCRLHDDGLPLGGWNPKEKLTLPELLKGYTIGSAFSVSREKEMGTLESGKLADLVVIDRNLFEISPEEIRKAAVTMTIMDGNIVYQKK